MKIDTHQHYWRYNPQDYGWMGDDATILKRDYLPEHLTPLLAQSNVDGTIAVQARQILAENDFLLTLAQTHSSIKGVVGWVDLCSDARHAQLETYAADSKFVGVRHVIHDEVDDTFMLRDAFVEGMAALAAFDLCFDLLLFPKHLPVACELVAMFPEQRFVLDHIAKPRIKDGVVEPWASDIRALAAFENVTCKLSGMVTEANWQHWQAQDFTPYLDTVLDAFGTKRLMLGSDWPVCTLAGSYPDVMGLNTRYISTLSSAEQADISGLNAARIYKLDDL